MATNTTSADTQEIGSQLVAEAERITSDFGMDQPYLETIAQRGYTIQREIGENQGATRRAFGAIRRVGNLTLEGVLKIPREEEEITSLNARINRGKKNLDLQEALINGKLRHPGIVRTMDSFQLPDERTVNFEDKIDGWSLRTFLERAGPVVDKQKLYQMFSPVIDALVYAHNGKYNSDRLSWIKEGVLHRDITPNNIIIPSAKGAGGVLTDWQNAAFQSDLHSISMPTRGGTGYTHPTLLNALVTGDKSMATETTEVYSLGATLYETVTGEKAFNYSVVEEEGGREITVEGKQVLVVLKDGKEILQTITPEMHRANVKLAREKMKSRKVPRGLVDLISDMLVLEGKTRIYEMETVQKRFKEATDTTVDNLKRDIPSYIKTALVTAATTAVVGLMACVGVYMANSPQTTDSGPTFSQIMMVQNRAQVLSTRGSEGIGGIQSGIYSAGNYDRFIAEATEKRELLEGRFDQDLEFASRAAPLDKKLASALLRSILMEKDRETLAGEDRYSYTLIPKSFIKASVGNRFREGEDNNEFRQKMWMGRYIQNCLSMGDSVEDVYAKALCDRGEIESAKTGTARDAMIHNLQKRGFTGIGGHSIPIGDVVSAYPTNNFNYFARAETKQVKLFGEEVDQKVFIPGYSEKLDSTKRRIIDRAALFYTLTDNNGKIHLENYHQSVKPISGEEAK